MTATSGAPGVSTGRGVTSSRRGSTGPPTLLLGHGRIGAAAIPAAVAQLTSSASARRSIA